MTAVVFDNVTDSWVRTSDLLDYNSTYTFMFWVYLTSDTNDYNTFFQISQGGYAPSDWIGTDNDGTTLQLYCQAASGGTTVNGSALSINTWYHITLVRESQTSFKCYLNGTLDITNTADMTGRAAATEMRFGSIASGDGALMRMAYPKEWSAVLSTAEIQTEKNLVITNRCTNRHGWWPMPQGSGERVKDYSGNGRNWTEGGTLTEDTPPPVSYGAPDTFVTFSGEPPQLVYVVSDTSAGAWTTDSGGTTNLYASVDETTFSDTDYIQSESAPSSSIVSLRLGTFDEPAVLTGHKLDYRYDKTPADGAQINLVVRIKQSSTTIASQTHTDIANGFVNGTLTLSEVEAGNITYPATLDVEFEATQV